MSCARRGRAHLLRAARATAALLQSSYITICIYIELWSRERDALGIGYLDFLLSFCYYIQSTGSALGLLFSAIMQHIIPTKIIFEKFYNTSQFYILYTKICTTYVTHIIHNLA